MPDLPSPELKAFLDAIDSFGEKPPEDLPEGVLDAAKDLGRSLRGYTGDEQLSPAEKEAKMAQGSDSAVPYQQAAKGIDGPSPGQKEYAQVVQQARELADSVSRFGGGSEQ